ncbi:MAG: serine/threonine-protein kinase [Prochloraceae cyanobacterium]|nr:serine/threonine-protein kinase [Prochloraceae cyanobacterium]
MTYLNNKTLQNGKYHLQQELGQGGFGITYKAVNTISNEVVVIKTLKLASTQKNIMGNLRKQFLDESRRLLKCSHPNIVSFREFFNESGLPFIVMDYIPGQTLDTVVLPSSPLPEATAIKYIRQVGEALKVVHQNGLLHRDIKPQNLILRPDKQQVVLIDFGIAREFSQGATQTHTNLISEGYAPIEQYLPRAKRTAGTDVYGVASTLYTLLTAQIPTAASLRDRLPLAAPKEIRPRLSQKVSDAVMRGMEIELRYRPASMDEWMALLPDPASLNRSVVMLGNNRPTIRSGMPQKLPPTQRDGDGLATRSKLSFITGMSAFTGIVLVLTLSVSKLLAPVDPKRDTTTQVESSEVEPTKVRSSVLEISKPSSSEPYPSSLIPARPFPPNTFDTNPKAKQ